MLRHFLRALAVVIVAAVSAPAADWPMFHGPNGDNKSADAGLLDRWPEGGPALLWTADFVGDGFSGVSVFGDRLYVTGNVKRDGKELSMVFCLDADGKKVWERDNGPAHANARTHPGTRGTPAVDGDFVYDASALGETTCFDAKTGEKIWTRNPLKEYDAPMPRWIYGHSLVFNGDRLVCMVGGPKALAVALDKTTGKTILEYPPTATPPAAEASYMTPYFFEFEGLRVLVAMSNATAEGYDADTGGRLFSIPWRNNRTTNVSMPIYRDGRLFLSSGYGFGSKLFTLTKNDDGTITASEAWHADWFDNHHGGVILVGDYVYGASSRGVRGTGWCAIHFLTGDAGYFERSNEEWASHYADGLIYGLSEKSKTAILLKPDPKAYIELGRFTLPNDAVGMSWAHPVVCGGKLYLRHGRHLYCYDVKAR